MCGICGMIASDSSKINMDLIGQMADAIKHRGPDNYGCEQIGNFAFGHRRLSIVDLSERGRQPLRYNDRYIIIHNGEIYNYIELRGELLALGYSFSTNTDTEVICAAYDAWGVECLHKFNGMWAFALLDTQTQVMFCSRDRFGVKPFYYTVRNEYIIFASEIKALLCDTSVPRKANEPVVFDYLAYGLLEHTHQTFFEGIYKLPAGHYAMIDRTLNVSPIRYYDIKFSDELGNGVTQEQIDQFSTLFNDAVKLRLRADVPIGSCLSGGLDSSAIVCALNGLREKEKTSIRQYTFSSCPNDKRVNESEFIDAVIKKTGVENQRFAPDSDSLIQHLDKLVYHQEEPFSSTGIYASMAVMEQARTSDIPVLMDGQGADEILCGYRKSRIYYIRRLIKKRHYLRAIKEFVLSFSQIKSSLSFRRDWYKILNILTGKNKGFTTYISNEFAAKEKGVGFDKSKDFQYNDLMVTSIPILLRYADRNAMAFAIEDRLPFLDYRLVEFCAGLPLSAKLENGYSKVILRASVDLPEKIRKRKSKMGFGVPEDSWLVEKASYFRKIFEAPDFRSGRFVNRELLMKDWDRIIAKRLDVALWRFISLELWMRKFNVE